MGDILDTLKTQILPMSPVFSTAEVADAAGVGVSSASRQLSELASRGVIAKVRRGLWADVRHATFSPYAVVPFLFEDPGEAYVSFLSALSLHGMIDQIPRRVQVAVRSQRRPLETAVGTYEFHQIKTELHGGHQPYREPTSFPIATPEKALFDILYVSARKGRRFSHLPELTLPDGFSWRGVKTWIDRIDHRPLRVAVENKWHELRSTTVVSESPPRLAEWVEAGLTRWRELLEKSDLADRFGPGWWMAAYEIHPTPEIRSKPLLLRHLTRAQGSETGWPPWRVASKEAIAPYEYEDGIEDASHSDFWRASIGGRLFLVRGFQEDDEFRDKIPGTLLDLTLPIWRVGECLLHAGRFATEVAPDLESRIRIRFAWTGLANRQLENFSSRSRRVLIGHYESHRDEVTAELDFGSRDLPDRLPELVHEAVAPLFDAFEFQPPSSLVDGEIQELLSRS